ncbi:C1q-related factor-like isoform X3 [Haliotis rufescens]|uniref:C1q-related factor-like isoform X3 n=1 Tax=Haliotis rufescens TaxID=6454 RepID=UPI00201F6D24|nr:C1q-related factor-like isoform X3 [Haliotis rufescens]
MEKVIICSIVALISLVLAAGSGLDKSSTLESVIARLAFNDRTTRSKTLESSQDKRDGENINARLEAVERQLLAFKSTPLERRTPCTSNRSHEFVSFQVKLTQHIKIVQKHEVLKFDKVTDNKGRGYHASSGIFEAPVSGTYLFWANILGYNNGYLNIALIKEGVVIGMGFGTYETKYSVAPLTFLTDMNEGEKVWFTKPDGTVHICGRFSNYGGVLLHAA